MNADEILKTIESYREFLDDNTVAENHLCDARDLTKKLVDDYFYDQFVENKNTTTTKFVQKEKLAAECKLFQLSPKTTIIDGIFFFNGSQLEKTPANTIKRRIFEKIF